MADAGGIEVGRVSIRVVPKIDPSIKKAVEKEARKLRDVKANIEPEVDRSAAEKAERDLNRISSKSRKARIEADVDLRRLKDHYGEGGKLVFESEIDRSQLYREIQDAEDDATGTIDFGTNLNSKTLVAKAKAAAALASGQSIIFRARMKGLTGSIAKMIETDQLRDWFRAKPLKFSADATSWNRLLQTTGLVKGDTDRILNGWSAIKSNMKAASRVRFPITMGPMPYAEYTKRWKAASRGRNEFFRAAGRGFNEMIAGATAGVSAWGSLTSAIKSTASVAWGFNAVAIVLAGTSSLLHAGFVGVSYVLGFIADSIKQLSGVIGLIPGAIAGIGMAGATAMVGFSGMGEALSAAVDTTADLEGAIAGLAPSAQDFARATREITPAWQEVRDQVQQTMFEGWGDQLRDISANLLPAVGKGMDQVAAGFNKMGDGVADFLKMPRTAQAMSEGFSITARWMDRLAESTQPFLTAMQEVGIIGMRVLTPYMDKLPGLAKDFEDFATSVEGQEKIDRWIQGGIDGFGHLRDAIGDTYRMFQEVGRAFGVEFDSDGLERFANSMERLRGWVGSADDPFSRISRFADRLEGFSSPWLDALPSISEDLSGTWENILDFSTDVNEELAKMASRLVGDVAPALESVTGFLKNNSDWLAPLAAGVAGLMAVAGIFRVLRGVFAPLIGLIGGIVRGLKQIPPVVNRVKSAFSNFRIPTWITALPGKLGNIASKLKSIKLPPLLTGLGGNLLSKLNPLLLAVGVLSGVAANFEKIKEQFKKTWEDLKNVFSGNFSWKDLLPDFSGSIQSQRLTSEVLLGFDPFEKGLEIGQKLWGGIRSGTEDVKKGGAGGGSKGFLDSIFGSDDEIQSSLDEKGASLGEKIREWWNKLREDFKKAQEMEPGEHETVAMGAGGNLFGISEEGIDSMFTRIGSKIREKFNELRTWITEFSMSDLTAPLANIWDSLSGMWGTAWANISMILSTWWTNISTTASTIFSNIVSTVSNAWSRVQSWTSSAWSSISSSVSGVVSRIWSSVSSTFSNIASKVQSAMGQARSSVSSAMSQIWSSISSTFSNIVSNVRSAMSQFASVVSQKFQEAVAKARALPGQFRSALGNLGGLLVASGRALVQGFIRGITSMIGAVRSAASSVVQAARNFFPSSPAKEGPLSGRGYTTFSGRALVKDFAGGIKSGVRSVQEAAHEVTAAVHEQFHDFNRNKVLQPVLEANAARIHDSREREVKAREESNKRIAEINASDADQVEKERQIAEERKRLSEDLARNREELNKSLEAPDYSDMNLSFKAYYVEGAKGLLNEWVEREADRVNLPGIMRGMALDGIREGRRVFGEHQVFRDIEMSVNGPHFERTVKRVIEEAELGAIPIEFAISNLDQLKRDLGMGDGVVSRAIDVGMAYNHNNSDAKWHRDNPVEVHYHVEDMNEAIRREQVRERKQMMKLGR